MVPEKKLDGKNELKCKYFDSSNTFHKNFYPTEKSSYIITKPNNFMKYVKNGYNWQFLMSQENKKTLLEKENEEVKKQKEEEVKKKEEEEVKKKRRKKLKKKRRKIKKKKKKKRKKRIKIRRVIIWKMIYLRHFLHLNLM